MRRFLTICFAAVLVAGAVSFTANTAEAQGYRGSRFLAPARHPNHVRYGNLHRYQYQDRIYPGNYGTYRPWTYSTPYRSAYPYYSPYVGTYGYPYSYSAYPGYYGPTYGYGSSGFGLAIQGRNFSFYLGN